MPLIDKWALGIFGLIILFLFVGSKEAISSLIPLIVIIFVICLYFKYRFGSAKISESRITDAAQSYNRFLSQIQESREIPIIPADFNTQPGEFVVMKADSAIYEQKIKGRRRMCAGTGVKIEKMPLYPGSGQSASNKAIVKISDGELYLTNRRLVFVGIKRSWDCMHSDVLSIENCLERIIVNCWHSTKPLMFDVMNGFYWEGLNKLFTQVRIDSPRLPDHVSLVGGRIERDTLPTAKYGN